MVILNSKKICHTFFTFSVVISQDDEVLVSKFQRLGSVSIDRGCLKQRVFHMDQKSNVACAVQVHLQADVDIGSVADDLPLQGYLVSRDV